MFSFDWTASNMNSLSMEPPGAVAGITSPVFGFIQTVGGALIGGYIGQLFNNTTIPAATSYFAMGVLSLVFILIAENGRLFGVGAEYAHENLATDPAH